MSPRPSFPPVIVIGMHRSGTSLVVRTLEALGLFTGVRRDRNDESLFFLDINRWILRQSGAAWAHPDNVRDLLDTPEVRALVGRYVSNLLHAPEVARYMGWPAFLRHRSPSRLPHPWGWKDPRNTYTLPIWLDLFPDARVVHVKRHGVDVAQSLMARQRRLLDAKSPLAEPRLKHLLRPPRLERRLVGGSFADGLPCLSLEGGFGLWERYVRTAHCHVERLGGRALEVRYEDFLHDPAAVVAAMAGFCGLPVEGAAIADLTRHLEFGRAFAYRRSPELRDFADRMHDRLAEQGY